MKKHFKSGGLFRSGTSQADKDDMADTLIAFQNERSRLALRIQAIPSFVDGGILISDIQRITELVEKDKKNFNAAQATQLLGALDLKITNLSDTWIATQKAEAKTALDTSKTYHGVALKLPTFETRFATIDTDAGKAPPDYAAIKASRDFVVNGRADLKLISDQYRTDYNTVLQMITDCNNKLPTIADPVVAPERATILTKIALAQQKLEEHSAWLAARLTGTITHEINAAVKIIQQKNDYAAVKQTAMTEFNKLTTALNPGADAEYPLIKADVDQAATEETRRDYYNASLIMKTIPARIAPLLALCTAYEEFEAALIPANTAIEQLKKHHLAEYVQADIKAIEAYRDACINQASELKYAAATSRLELVPQRCTDAVTEAEKAAPFADLLKDAPTGDLNKLLADVKTSHKTLEGHARAAQIDEQIKTLAKSIETAETAIKDGDQSNVRAALSRGADTAALAYRLAQTIDQIYTRADDLGQRVEGLEATHQQANYIKDKLAVVTKLAEEARKAALAGDDKALGLLVEGEAKVDAARKLADAEDAFRIRLADTRKAATDLDKTTYPDKAKTGAKITEHLVKAQEHSANFDPVKANGSLSAAEALLAVAKLATLASTSGDMDEADIRALIALPDGQKQLDAMVASLPGNTSQKVMSKLLSVRFNMDVKLFTDETTRTDDGSGAKTGVALNAPAPNLKAYYELLTLVPETDTKLNPSLARFDRIEDETGSYYESTNGAVVMACFNDFNVQGNSLGNPVQLDVIDDECKPVPDTEVPRPTYGKWTTLHEIGHAVDDRKGFMRSNGSGAEFGGWREHGSDTSQISAEIADEFDFDTHYVERKMSGGSPDLPPPPDGVSQGDWETRRDNFINWLAAVRTTTDIWDSATNSNARHMSKTGRMIHEAYPDHWVSYNLSARRKGITGYQFRAPGEWFSELYAAYHTKKLKPTHPAQKWLSKL
ncbi:hypothetical protein [Pseudosulfitobacter koreensis]|uniref:Uncharacterized protein n=1 Tax=Pseudosulfitobacter koreensis TaxID=2968472 RepID=A0ABT1Z2K0_9RHOB|nr:hypothetical protein [Pseudosulfitobacter koreense]MCR8827338.1 hypothetical protein [Pseudosulfitobacter koreense]